jgi:hypothetical protein
MAAGRDRVLLALIASQIAKRLILNSRAKASIAITVAATTKHPPRHAATASGHFPLRAFVASSFPPDLSHFVNTTPAASARRVAGPKFNLGE